SHLEIAVLERKRLRRPAGTGTRPLPPQLDPAEAVCLVLNLCDGLPDAPPLGTGEAGRDAGPGHFALRAGAGLWWTPTLPPPAPPLPLPLRGRGPLGGRLLGPLPALLLGVEDDALRGGDVVGGHVDAEILLDVRLHLARGGGPPHRLQGTPDRLLFGDLFRHV